MCVSLCLCVVCLCVLSVIDGVMLYGVYFCAFVFNCVSFSE